ncbi:MAG: hypothetical protein RR962_04215 [Hafnia sp.]
MQIELASLGTLGHKYSYFYIERFANFSRVFGSSSEEFIEQGGSVCRPW